MNDAPETGAASGARAQAITDGAAIATAYATRVEVGNTLIIGNVANTGIANPHIGDSAVLLSYCDNHIDEKGRKKDTPFGNGRMVMN